ncbi:hypothetical protein ACAW49_09560 [Pseudomonas sp. Env-44]|jgi:hypothetical protein|uniref:hypothetical protein n=1 Tax=unclassified Pseudomonas TaxID=196821 RepID=UPI000CD3AFE0|nr:hypothetical protein C2U56_02755 [Pseudomonas fluorescens]
MSVFMVTWNLNREGDRYNEARRLFIQNLERYDNTKDSGLESVRWINSGATAQQISDDLSTKVDGNDHLVIIKMNRGEFYGWLAKETWAWIEARL